MNENANALNFPGLVLMGVDSGTGDGLGLKMLAHAGLFAKADKILAAGQIYKQLLLQPHLRDRARPLVFPMAELASRLRREVLAGKKILILADGDPLYFGIGSSLQAFFGSSEILFLPAVSSLQAASARIGLPWHEIRSVSLHGRSDLTPLLRLANQHKSIFVLLGNGPRPDAVARALLDRGIDAYEAIIFEKMGSEAEKIERMSLENCAMASFGDCASLLLLPQGKMPEKEPAPLAGAYHTSDSVTALVQYSLDIQAEEIIWDIGSGSGRIALTFSRSAHNGVVFALECRSDRILDIQLNRKSWKAANLVPVYGFAPEILSSLPKPDKIFIGGGLSAPQGSEILDNCARRLAPGGKMAISCILLESLRVCQDFLKRKDWKNRIWQLQSCELGSLGNGTRLKADNPVFVILVEKPLD